MATLKELDIKLRAFMRFYRYKRYDWTPNAPLNKPLNECRFGLVTTAGLHLPDQPSFDEKLKRGDCSYREIPNDIDVQTLQISQKSEAFGKSGAYEDRNLVFPLGRFREFAKLLGITPETLRVWEKEGKIKPFRTKGRHRRYDDEMLLHKSKPQIQKM